MEHTSHGTARAEFHLSSEGAKVHSSSGTAGRRSSSEEQAACRSSTDSRAAAEPGGAQKVRTVVSSTGIPATLLLFLLLTWSATARSLCELQRVCGDAPASEIIATSTEPD